MRNGRMESKEETEASPLPGLWPQLPITRCCETVVVSHVDSDARSVYWLSPILLFLRVVWNTVAG